MNRLVRQMAPVKIGQSRLTIAGLDETVMEEIACHFIDLVQAVPFFVACHVFCRLFHFRQGNVSPFGQAFYRLAEGNVLPGHDELEDVAVGVTAKAVIEAFVRGDAEGSRLFIMERAASPEVTAPPLEGYVIRDDADNIVCLAYLFYKFTGKPHIVHHLQKESST